MDSTNEVSERLRQEIAEKASNKLTELQMEVIMESLDLAQDYAIRATYKPDEFAGWITLRNYESKHAGLGQHCIVDTGICIISRDLEFGKDTHYDYKDNGIAILNEEKRITNFNTTEVIVSLFKSHEYSSFATKEVDQYSNHLYLFIPRRLIDEPTA
ncbi:hypothetical protein EHS13_32575 [Paenibacillus psychroresistens]|uniref:Uncharacterized protein n=1 Tax=Paenibacillus psychroresistens TaxID=1778678 RepID=A0A6B8RV09_9BACL|nr:hypothetical protein [Paenibacillus psychroresistens]QGQ99263.1 hypothetical protein EHS13_32575 [Paenibacillus psychroresistens]